MRKIGRTTAVLAAAGILLASCAQPGQLGMPLPETTPPAPADAQPVPEPVGGTTELAAGTLHDRLRLRTTEPTAFSVRTVVLPPGESTGWHRHPGTELSIVKSGTVGVVRQDACEPTHHGPGDAVHVDDRVPHQMRNDGTEPVELVVAYLLVPGAPEQTDVAPGCPVPPSPEQGNH
ncbi:cupin domain-containing protein [Pseudonocardia hispaniensis]|uniref:Cupin domain-containing protein n=1 Tax=Pseudonocardia hispaniensis TaxID=904933 RepID=A0ABW1J5P4_9PSEU